MDDVHQPFTFEYDGRSFSCEVARLRRSSPEVWWCFRVTPGDLQRYAPFRADARDTRADVQARVSSYYDDLLDRRASPLNSRWHRNAAAARPATPGG